jgi:hypothetical protein
LIGVPVAGTPAFGPHEEVSVLAAAVLLVVPVALDELEVVPAPLELLELLLELPHPATATANIAPPQASISLSRLSGLPSQLPISSPRSLSTSLRAILVVDKIVCNIDEMIRLRTLTAPWYVRVP